MKRLIVTLAVVAALVGAVVALRGAVTSAQNQPDDPLSSSQQEGQEGTAGQERPWLGVRLVRTPDGVAVGLVIADSPADKAGLARGDVIETIDDADVEDVRDVVEGLAGKSAGDTVTLGISRDGRAQDIAVTLEARPEPLPRAIPLLPELEGIPADEMFSHFQGGQFDLTDADGNAVTVTLEPGTVAGVDAGAGTLTVDLNSGDSKTYTIEEGDVVMRGGLSELAEGDNVVVMSVNGDVRAVMPGGKAPFLPGLGGGHRGFRGHHGPGFDGFDGGRQGGFDFRDAAPEPAAPDGGL